MMIGKTMEKTNEILGGMTWSPVWHVWKMESAAESNLTHCLNDKSCKYDLNGYHWLIFLTLNILKYL